MGRISMWLIYYGMFTSILATFGSRHPSVSNELYTESMEMVTLHPSFIARGTRDSRVVDNHKLCIFFHISIDSSLDKAAESVEGCIQTALNRRRESNRQLYAGGNMLIAALSATTYKIHRHSQSSI